MLYNNKTLSIRNNVAKFAVEQDIDLNKIFLNHILQCVNNGDSLLDIGTGNGFVLSQILREIEKEIKLFGIDNSKEMVASAIKNLGKKAKIIEAESSNLPFENCSFDVVTARNVTRICVPEIFRVLKDNGIFIFREYGRGKGLMEIAELFNGRIIRQKDPDCYINNLLETGFAIIKFSQFKILRKYKSARELISVVKSFPFIQDFSRVDEGLILKKFANNAIITSDPFILIANKLKGGK